MKASLLFLAAYFDLRSRITTHRSLTNWKAEINKQRQSVCFDFLFFAKDKNLSREKRKQTQY
ncbi:hypothetical protein M5Z91_11170, partial [Neisseria meningitidis]|nr:hypothetical protein [Neisseria meningitidis]